MNLLSLDDTSERLLGRCLRRQAEKIPDADCIVWDEERFSFGRVNELANASARAFRELGVGAGDTVCFLMESCPEWIWTTLGLNKLGAVWVPTNVDYKGAWLRESLEDAASRISKAPEDLHLAGIRQSVSVGGSKKSCANSSFPLCS